MDRFQDFEVWIDAPTGTDIGRWSVRAFGAAGPASGRLDLDLGDPFRTQLEIATGADASRACQQPLQRSLPPCRCPARLVKDN